MLTWKLQSLNLYGPMILLKCLTCEIQPTSTGKKKAQTKDPYIEEQNNKQVLTLLRDYKCRQNSECHMAIKQKDEYVYQNLTAFTNVRKDVSLPSIVWTKARNRYSPSLSARA
jgi:hypothetical protein